MHKTAAPTKLSLSPLDILIKPKRESVDDHVESKVKVAASGDRHL